MPDKKSEGEKGDVSEEEEWQYFTTRMDTKGRLAVTPDVRENLGVYKKAAQVEVKIRVLRIYEKEEKGEK